MRLMNSPEKHDPSDAASDRRSPSQKYSAKDIKPEDVVVDKPDGLTAPVAFLPIAEMPSKKVFGNIDPLEGSPAREMTKKMMKGDLPLGDFIKNDAVLSKLQAAAASPPGREKS